MHKKHESGFGFEKKGDGFESRFESRFGFKPVGFRFEFKRKGWIRNWIQAKVGGFGFEVPRFAPHWFE